MFALRCFVTRAISLPIWVVRQPRDTVEIFVIAVMALGAGHLVDAHAERS